MDDYFSSVLPILLLLMEQGFKFDPSHEELISKYLVPKTRGDIMRGLPMAVVNLCEHEPWDLPGKSIIKLTGQVAWYFLCPRELRGKVHHRKTKAGYWKPTSQQKSITAEHTKKNIGVVRTLRFYEKQVRTGWMIYEFDLIAKSSQFKKGQFVLCKLEFDSKGEKSKKGEQSHHIAPVSHSEVEPSQSMDSDSENINPSEMAMRYSPCDESELSHHAGSHFANQNPSELMNNSSRQLSELSHHMASEFRNHNSNNLMPNLVCDGSGSSHSTVFNCEDLYWNQPTVDSAYNGSESPYMAFDSENQNPNELPTVDNSASNVSKNHGMAFGLANHNPNVSLTVDNSTSNVSESHHMALVLENQNLNNSISILTCENSLMASRGLENQEPFFPPCSFINQSTYDKSESSSLMDFDFVNQNLVKEFDISAFGEGVWSNTTATPPDFGNQNPCKKTDMSTLEEGYSSYFNSSFSDNDPADVALPEVSPGLQAGIEGCFEQENSPDPALVQLPACMEESHSFRGFGTLENKEPFFPPCSFINQSMYDKSESSSLMNFDFGNQNPVKEFDISAFGEGVWSNTTATPDFGNQNPCKKTDMSTLEEGYSSYFNSSFSENDPADVAIPEVSPGLQAGIEGCFEQENIPNPALVQLPACMEESHSFRGFGTLENKEPFFPPCSFINQSTYDKSESSSLMNFDFGNQNPVKEFDISAFGEGVWSNTTATRTDFGNQNPCKKTDMATLEEGYSSYFNSSSSDNDLADVALPEVSPGLQAGIEGCFEQENSPNPALVQLPARMEESNSFRGFGTLENQEPFFPPCSFINQSTYDKSESSSLMNFDFGNQNPVKEFDISAFGEGVWSNTTATPLDFGNQNPCKKTDMATLEEGYSSYFNSSSSDNDLADVALPEQVSPGLQAEIEGCFEQENSPNPAPVRLPFLGFE